MMKKNIIERGYEWMLAMAFVGVLFAFFDTISYFGGGIESSNYYTLIVCSLIYAVLVIPVFFIRHNEPLHLGLGDIAVALFLFYFLVNSYFTNSLDSTEFRMAISYFLLYFSFKIVLTKYPNFWDYAVIVILMAGVYQSVLVLQQLYGFEMSNHHRFVVTGSFFNPGPCGIFLAGVLVLSVTIVKDCKFTLSDKFDYLKGGLAYVVLFTTLLAIVPTMSRAGWVGAIIGIAFIYRSMINVVAQKMKMCRRNTLMIMGFGVIMLFAAIYFLKKDSANGRLFIWENSIIALGQSPVFGVGVANFAESYSQQQYQYFVTAEVLENDDFNLDVAGVPTYMFNELLSVTLLLGVIGFLFVAYILYRKLSYQISPMIIALLCASLFSYTFYIAPIAIIFIVAMACQKEKSYFICSPKIILSCFLLIIALCIVSNRDFKTELDSEREWRSASIYYSMKDYESCVEDYEKLLPHFKDNYKFMFEYGHSLNKIGKYEMSNNILKEGARKSVDPMFWTIIGNNYLELENYMESESAYLRAYYMCPNRLYPLYLLAKMSHRKGDKNKLNYYGTILLNKKPKIKSSAVTEMKDEITKILRDF